MKQHIFSKELCTKLLKRVFIKLLIFLKSFAVLILNPRFILCFGIAWIITNGWSYAAAAIGAYFEITWLTAISGSYIAFLWLPVTPEKLITLTISLLLLRKLFPNDTKTLGQLRALYSKAKKEFAAATAFLRNKKKQNRKENKDHDS